MNRLRLLTTTAIFAGVLAVSMPAQAQDQGWYSTMKTKVQNWFADDTQVQTHSNAEVEAYLDEVTVAVPPTTTYADDANRIEPAAGSSVDYNEIENLQDQQSLNTDFDYDTSSSVTAFGDQLTAEDLNNIETAAGDAEEITDESIVVAEDGGIDVGARSTIDVGNTSASSSNDVNVDTDVNTNALDAVSDINGDLNVTSDVNDDMSDNDSDNDSDFEAASDIDGNLDAAAQSDMDSGFEAAKSIDGRLDAAAEANRNPSFQAATDVDGQLDAAGAEADVNADANTGADTNAGSDTDGGNDSAGDSD